MGLWSLFPNLKMLLYLKMPPISWIFTLAIFTPFSICYAVTSVFKTHHVYKVTPERLQSSLHFQLALPALAWLHDRIDKGHFCLIVIGVIF